MKAVVLAGGYATRLRPISYAIPKLLFPVVGQPMIYWTLDLLREFGIDAVVLGVNYMADTLRKTVGDRYKGVSVRYSLEKTPLGTAGPIRLASDSTSLRDTFIAMNGDVIADIDLDEMLAHHKRTGALVTDALHEVSDPSRFGIVQLDHADMIKKFIEKPEAGRAPTRLANAGIYLIDPDVLKMIPPGRRVSLEREIFPVLARRNKLAGFPFKGYWFDIGDLSDYREANFRLIEKIAPNSLVERRTRVASASTIKPPSFVGSGSRIEAGAAVGPFGFIGKNGWVQRKARVSKSILFEEVTVGQGTVVSGAIVATGVTIGKNVRVEPGSILSPGVHVHDDVRIGKAAVVHPYKEVSSSISPGSHEM